MEGETAAAEDEDEGETAAAEDENILNTTVYLLPLVTSGMKILTIAPIESLFLTDM